MRKGTEVEPRDSRRAEWMFRTLVAVCVMVFAADFIFEKHGYVPWERWFGFQGGFGFLSGLVLVVAARSLGRILGRREDYYER
jgi:uncharacterized membrane protein